MFLKRISGINKGDVITAEHLTKLGRAANRSASSMKAENATGFLLNDAMGQSTPRQHRVHVVRMKRDVVPQTYKDYSALTTNTELNAVIQQRDVGSNGVWVDTPGCEVQVEASDLPLLANEIVVVMLSKTSGVYTPIERQYKTAMVRVTSTELNSAGYQDGELIQWDSVNKVWTTVRTIHVLDATR